MTSHELAPKIRAEIENADTLIIVRTTNGKVAVTINDNAQQTRHFTNEFDAVITDLVASDMITKGAEKIVIRRVSPPIMFSAYPRHDFFNISVRGDKDQLLGGREGLKKRSELALNLALKLSPT